MTRKSSRILESGSSSPSTAKINWIPEKVLSLIASVELVKTASGLGKTDWASVTALWSQQHSRDASNHTKASLRRKLSAQYVMKDRAQRSWSGVPRTLDELDIMYPDLMTTFRQRLLVTQGTLRQVSAPDYLSDDTNVQTSFEAVDECVDETISPACIGIDFIALTESFRYNDEVHRREPLLEIPRVNLDTMLDYQSYASFVTLKPKKPASAKGGELQEFRETWNNTPFTPVQESKAHDLRISLLFRFYGTSAEHVVNSPCDQGFVAGFFKDLQTRVPAPLPCQLDMLFVEILKHINQEKVPSKFISTSSHFLWTIRQAFQALAKDPGTRMSVIDARKAAGPGGKHLYRASPYTRQLRERKAYNPGKWFYSKVSNQECRGDCFLLISILLA